MQTDAAVGEVLAALDKHGLADNTLVIFTSDNGCSPQADFPELRAKGHNPSHVFRGHKADIFEGGHRVPFLVRWPGKVKPAATADQLVCLTDLMAHRAPRSSARSCPTTPARTASASCRRWRRATGPLREAVVHHSINGSFAIRQGKWKLASAPAPAAGAPRGRARTTRAKLPPVQLYDLAADSASRRTCRPSTRRSSRG